MTDMQGDWVNKLMDGAFADPGDRITKLRCDEVEIDGQVVGRVRLTFTVEDLRGETYEARGRVLIPNGLQESPRARLPLVMNCGYEADEAVGAKQVALGRVSATTIQLPLDAIYPLSWSLVRGPKMEFVLGHLVRSLPFVDPAKVVYSGGSAGGYSALLAAAEAFPAAAAVPGVPPTNIAYMAAFWATNHARLAGTDAVSVEMLTGFLPAAVAWHEVFGEDYDAPAWLEHSPVGHLDRITCPVATFFSMADCLVPIEQVGHELARPIIEARPGGLETRAEAMSPASTLQVRLLDALGERATVQVVTPPPDAERMVDADLTMLTELPPLALPTVTPVAGHWSVSVADEGEPVFAVSHVKHQFEPDLKPFAERALQGEISVDQLTAAKLDQLLDRYSGVEWFSPAFGYLDRPEAERADVERGLRTFCGVSGAHAARFRELYQGVIDDRRVLPEALVAELAGS